ncbi:glycosyltransferase family 1 protein [Parabacteroides sp. 52]|uniref:glycosyltransferase n=1 Tax=unclassified Parabacteroides TaxID=2649774 RepID=UPI0013D4D3FC|nr:MULTISPECIES: glycosyltransferase [unclassified Parabacteroides]MDH6534234.1 glycosyltransferase involved in cell wall biosynthesis [Parabacteroides sp. PM5-20]NDV55382.1 glycosyltransferase family 1 protein [Parabacteroides sp. 52]
MKKEHIILIEPDLTGHHQMYLCHFTEALLRAGHKVTVCSSQPEIEGIDPSLILTVKQKKAFALPSKGWLKKAVILLNLYLLIRNLYYLKKKLPRNGKWFFCCIDTYMHVLMPLWLINRLLPLPFSGLLLSPYRMDKKLFHLDRRNILKAKNCKSVGVLDVFCREELEVFQPHIIHFPDFTDAATPDYTFAPVNEIREKAKGRIIIALVGSLSLRKGYRTLIDSIKHLPSTDYFFVIAGKLDKPDQMYFEDLFQKKENAFYYPHPIPTESDFNALVDSCHILYAAYVHFSQSSNMLAKASLFRKPLIVNKGYYMEKIVRKYNLGLAIDPDNPEACAQAIRTLTHRDTEKRLFEAYYEANSLDRLYAAFQEVVDSYIVKS